MRTPSKDERNNSGLARSPNSLNRRAQQQSTAKRPISTRATPLPFVERVQIEMARLTPGVDKSAAKSLNGPYSNLPEREGLATFQPNSPIQPSPRPQLFWPFSPATILKRKELSMPRARADDLSPILNLVQFHSPNPCPENRSDHHSDDCLTPRRLFDECHSPRTTIYSRQCKASELRATTEYSPQMPSHEHYLSRAKVYAADYTRTSTVGRHSRISGYSAGSATPFSLSDSQYQTKGDRIIRKRKRKTI